MEIHELACRGIEANARQISGWRMLDWVRDPPYRTRQPCSFSIRFEYPLEIDFNFLTMFFGITMFPFHLSTTYHLINLTTIVP